MVVGAPVLMVGLVLAGMAPIKTWGPDEGHSGSGSVPVAYVAPSAAHPYSDPVWWPLRSPAVVSCVKTNCAGPFHNYWALDLIADPPGQSGDPIYAAGAGIFHVGAVDPSCKATSKDEGGTWVWVDHGGGKVSRYHHLSSVSATEGQRVTPNTMIGRMGHSGDVAPCTTNYLHFEVRVHGVKGARVAPGSLLACRSTTRQTWPNAWGKTSWDALTRGAVTTPSATSSCLTTPWAGTPAAPASVRGTRGSGRATVTWPAQYAGTNRIVVAMETYHPSVPEWGAPTYRTLSSTARSSTYTGLQNGRKYRWKVTSHNSGGNSAWSSYVNLTPAAAPTTPRVPRWLAATSTKVRYAWWSSTARGTPVTSYTVSIRARTSSGYSTWRRSTVSAGVLNYNWTTVTRGRTYQVTVRANSAVGPSPWATYKSVRVP